MQREAAGTVRVDPFFPAHRMLALLRARAVSAVELLELHLSRIQRYNPQLNAIVTLDADRARAMARAADALRARGEERPMLGLPVTIKDAIDLQGLPTTSGVRARKDRIAHEDALAVARLRQAGTVFIGKTNVPPNTGDWQTDNKLFGRTNNPWDLERTPGGSTGGGAAAVAAGLSPLELGSDIGGSIREPAAFCGIFGHRPSDSATPRSGQFPGSPLPNPGVVLNVIGPLARDAADLGLALDVLAGPEVGEEAWRLELPPPRHERLSEYRVATLPWPEWQPVEPEIRQALDTLAERLRAAGATVAEAQPDMLGDLRGLYTLYLQLLSTIFGFTIGRTPEQRRSDAEALLAIGTEDAMARAAGAVASADDYLGWLAEREAYRASYRRFFGDWDVMLAPAAIVLPFTHRREPHSELAFSIEGRPVAYWRLSFYAGIATLTGQPATAFPAGLTREGLPIGLQAIGPYLEDRTPIRFAQLVAEAFGGYEPPPGYAD